MGTVRALCGHCTGTVRALQKPVRKRNLSKITLQRIFETAACCNTFWLEAWTAHNLFEFFRHSAPKLCESAMATQAAKRQRLRKKQNKTATYTKTKRSKGDVGTAETETRKETESQT